MRLQLYCNIQSAIIIILYRYLVDKIIIWTTDKLLKFTAEWNADYSINPLFFSLSLPPFCSLPLCFSPRSSRQQYNGVGNMWYIGLISTHLHWAALLPSPHCSASLLPRHTLACTRDQDAFFSHGLSSCLPQQREAAFCPVCAFKWLIV